MHKGCSVSWDSHNHTSSDSAGNRRDSSSSASCSINKPDKGRFFTPAVIATLATLLVVGSLFTWWTINQADGAMRRELSLQTQLVARAVNVEDLRSLSGAEADLGSPAYMRIKKQFAAMMKTDNKYRFIYLLGRNEDGGLFFFVDNEPVGSEDESPAGMPYEDAPEGFRRSIETKTSATAGPFSDRWGSFVSGCVPLVDPHTDKVLALQVVDFDASSWQWDIAARCAIPVGLMLMLIIGVVGALAATRRVDPSPKPVMRRLLPYLGGMVFVLTAGTGIIFWQQHKRALLDEIQSRTFDASQELEAAIDNQAYGMSLAAASIAADASLRDGLKNSRIDDAARWRRVFDAMSPQSTITRLTFMDAGRRSVLNVHDGAFSCEVINTHLAIKAQQMQATAWGIQLEPSGEVTLTLVEPVKQDGAVVGFIELGKPIDDVLTQLHMRSNNEIAIAIDKKLLDRRLYGDAGKGFDWQLLPTRAVIWASQGIPAKDLADLAAQGQEDGDLHDGEASHEDKHCILASMPLRDASGRDIGRMIVIRDMTARRGEFMRLMWSGGALGVTLLTLLLSLIYVLLRRTDAAIRTQQRELRENEARLDQLAQRSRTIAWEVDERGLFTYISHVCKDVLGYEPQEFIGRHFYDLHDSKEPAFTNAAGDLLNLNKPFDRVVHSMTASDGKTVWVATDGMPIYDEEGMLKGFRGGDTDITEHRLAQETIIQTNRQLEQAIARANEMALQAQMADATKSEFLANMSHEIRTPMTAILGFVDLVRDALESCDPSVCELNRTEGPARLEHINTIGRNGQHLLRLINDILDLSKIESGKMCVEQVKFQPVRIVEEVLSMMRVRAAQKNLALEASYDLPLPKTVIADPTRMRQILVNLVGNAIKFTSTGSVSISVRHRAAQDGKGMIHLDVHDTGIGMTRQQLAGLFSPFSQADASTTRHFGGTGLGLAISKKLAHAMGGDITIESTPGEGSTFHLVMAAEVCPEDGMITEVTSAEPDRPADQNRDKHIKLTGRILLAEDGKDNQRLISTILRLAGAEVDVVENGLQAVQAVRDALEHNHPYDIILMDMQMPEMDGYQASSSIRDIGVNTPIVALTAHSMPIDRQKCLSAGCSEYISKPIDRRHLMTLLQTMLADHAGVRR